MAIDEAAWLVRASRRRFDDGRFSKCRFDEGLQKRRFRRRAANSAEQSSTLAHRSHRNLMSRSTRPSRPFGRVTNAALGHKVLATEVTEQRSAIGALDALDLRREPGESIEHAAPTAPLVSDAIYQSGRLDQAFDVAML
jgi:hypothetical protein